MLQAELICGDVGDRTLLQQIFATHDIAAVIHFAAYTYVRESVEKPSKYYRNNVVATLTLLEEMVAAGVKQLVFSSTCATYGLLSSKSKPFKKDHQIELLSHQLIYLKIISHSIIKSSFIV